MIAVVEKDFWVCLVLKYLFEQCSHKEHLVFKGGTSLSKAFGLIERFSEDIDLILDWELLGFSNKSDSEKNPWAERSKTKQDKFNKEVNAVAAEYIKNKFVPIMQNDFEKIGLKDLSIWVDQHDVHIVNISYPHSSSNDYIRPEIRLEIGPLASWVPNEEYCIKSYAAEEFPDVFENPDCRVKVIIPERTFWEKATILHLESYRPAEKPFPLRYSRHYYDLFKMAGSEIKKGAFSKVNLLKEVVEFKQRFYPCSWARYDLAKIGSLRLLPPENSMKGLREDYSAMHEMIFRDPPNFDFLLKELKELEIEINEKLSS